MIMEISINKMTSLLYIFERIYYMRWVAMGYHVKYKELQSVQQNILNQIDNWYNQLEEVAKKLVDVAEMDHIKGDTGKSIKNYIYEVHIQIIQMFTQLLAEYETKFLIYANKYYEIDSSTSAKSA